MSTGVFSGRFVPLPTAEVHEEENNEASRSLLRPAPEATAQNLPKHPKTNKPRWMNSPTQKIKTALTGKAKEHKGLASNEALSTEYLAIRNNADTDAAQKLQNEIATFFSEERTQSAGGVRQQLRAQGALLAQDQVDPVQFIANRSALRSAQKQVLDDIVREFPGLDNNQQSEVLVALVQAAPHAMDEKDLKNSLQRRVAQTLTVLTHEMPTSTTLECDNRAAVFNALLRSISEWNTQPHAPKALQRLGGHALGVAGAVAVNAAGAVFPPALIFTIPLSIGLLAGGGILAQTLPEAKQRKAQNTAATFGEQEIDFINRNKDSLSGEMKQRLRETWAAAQPAIVDEVSQRQTQTVGHGGTSLLAFWNAVDACIAGLATVGSEAEAGADSLLDSEGRRR